jgi:hypothetical protein
MSVFILAANEQGLAKKRNLKNRSFTFSLSLIYFLLFKFNPSAAFLPNFLLQRLLLL